MDEKKHKDGFRLRWKMNEPRRGLARITEGPLGATLRDANGTQFATVQSIGRELSAKWFWVAGWGSGVPHMNTCDEPVATRDKAKADALQYVRDVLSKATGEQS